VPFYLNLVNVRGLTVKLIDDEGYVCCTLCAAVSLRAQKRRELLGDHVFDAQTD
jgi:hypothetical protein